MENLKKTPGNINSLVSNARTLARICSDDGESGVAKMLNLLCIRVEQFEGALRRLASPEAFDVPKWSDKEMQMRMRYADNVLRGGPLDISALKEESEN